MTGVRVGRLVVQEPAGRVAGGDRLWLCACDCGGSAVVRQANLRHKSRPTLSCGCINREHAARIGSAKRTHGATCDERLPEYGIWENIKTRCYNTTNKCYHMYGGRGITVCDEWRDSFESFFAHVGNRPSPQHSIDRIDNSRGYEPGNVRWATAKMQARNRRSTRLLEYNGERRCVAEWAEVTGIPIYHFANRLRRGWSDRRVFASLEEAGYL